MASAIESPPTKDLTRCGICKEVIDKPKALSCLHTFCLECLREWSQQDQKSVTCPVMSCKKTTSMPSDGIDGLPGNVFVESLIENSPTQSKMIPCACCEETTNVVLAKCLDCNGFLCQEGIDMHKKPLLRSHQVIQLEDVKSGKVDLKKLASKKKPTCGKHEGQALWFFCQTCEVLICQICTVINHQKPEHTYVDLESVVSEHKKNLEQLVKQNETIKAEVEKRIEETVAVRKAIDVHLNDISEEIDQVTEQFRKRVEAVCRAEKERLAKKRADIKSKASKELGRAEESLDSQRESLQTALNMAKQVLQTGSDYDIASVFQQISSVLKRNSEIKPQSLSQEATCLPEFFVDPILDNFKTIGSLRQYVPFTSAVLEGSFGAGDVAKEPGRLNSVRGISTTAIGDIAIANYSSCTPVKVYSISGKYKYSLDATKSKNAVNVATDHDGQCFVTTMRKKYVTVYGSDGHYKFQFATVSPTGVSSETSNTQPRGIAVNSTKSQVLIGDTKMKYISIHQLNGTHCSSISLTVTPEYITTTRQGAIVVSPNEENRDVHILDTSGTLLHTIYAPEGVTKWYPVGVCCDSLDDIFVSNRGEPVGIYRFSSSGSYLGCVIKDIKCSCTLYGGLSFSKDGEKLVVCFGSCDVKIFCRRV